MLLDKGAVLDLKGLTGESASISVSCGEEILAGSINLGEAFILKTIRDYKDSATEKIIAMVEGALAKKSKSQRFISSFAKVYTPIVFILALFVAFVPPLFDMLSFNKWIYKSLSFLVVSCPCSVVISVPLSFYLGLGALAKKGILIKGTNYLELLSKANVAVFDKTGTLTKGNLIVDKVLNFNNFDLSTVINYAITLEKSSSHPIASAILAIDIDEKEKLLVNDLMEISGKGVMGNINGNSVLLGNDKLLQEKGVYLEKDYYQANIYLSINGLLAGAFVLKDELKENSKDLVGKLKKLGINKCIMLSGDKKTIAESVGKEVKLDAVYSDLLPEDKYKLLGKIIAYNKKGKTVYVGDGINDAPALAQSDVGIAMGVLGSDQAIESADLTIMDDDLSKIPLAIKQSKRIVSIVYQNIIGSILIKLGVMITTFIITLPVWIAILADVGLLIVTILNSLRCAKIK